MKTKLLTGIATTMFTVIIGLNVKMNSHENKSVDLKITGVEALAQSENGEGSGVTSCTVTHKCWDWTGFIETGEVSCTGSHCERGSDFWSGKGWVKCDGNKTSC